MLYVTNAEVIRCSCVPFADENLSFAAHQHGDDRARSDSVGDGGYADRCRLGWAEQKASPPWLALEQRFAATAWRSAASTLRSLPATNHEHPSPRSKR